MNLNQKQLAAGLLINENVMGKITLRLERKGLLERPRYPDNRRAYQLEVSLKGKQLLERMYEGWPQRSTRIFSPIKLEDVKKASEEARKLIRDFYEKDH